MGIFDKFRGPDSSQENNEVYKPAKETTVRQEGDERPEGSKEGGETRAQLAETHKRSFAETIKAGIVGKLCQPKYVAATMILIAGIRIAGGMDIDSDSIVIGADNLDLGGLIGGHHDAHSVISSLDQVNISGHSQVGDLNVEMPEPPVSTEQPVVNVDNNDHSGFHQAQTYYEDKNGGDKSDIFLRQSTNRNPSELPQMDYRHHSGDYVYGKVDKVDMPPADIKEPTGHVEVAHENSKPDAVETSQPHNEPPVAAEKKPDDGAAHLGGKKPSTVKIGGQGGLKNNPFKPW